MNDVRPVTALITRPEEDAADTAVALTKLGIVPVVAPMTTVEPAADADPAGNLAQDLEGAQAVLFTSRNGVRAFCGVSGRRDLPAFAVGDSTAALARGNGFARVESAGGDSADLARLVIDRLRPDAGPLFHAAGETVAGNLSETLGAADFEVVRRTLYRAVPADALPTAVRDALAADALDYVLFYSPRTARIFTGLVAAADLAGRCRRLTAVCLSPAVAGELAAADWKAINIAPRPTTESLLQSLDVPDRSFAAAPEPAHDISPEGAGTPPGADEGTDMTPPDRKETDPTDAAAVETVPEIPDGKGTGTAPSDGPAAAAKTSGKRARSTGATVAWTLLAVVVLLGVAVATLPGWRDRLPAPLRDRLAGPGAGSDAVIALTQHVEALAAADAARTEALVAARKSAAALADTVARLDARLAEAAAAIAEIRAAPKTAGGPSPELIDRLARIEQRLDGAVAAQTAAKSATDTALAAATAAGAERTDALARLAGRADALEARLQTLEGSLAASRSAAAAAGKTDTLALAAGQLRDALARTAPFAAELATVRRLGAGDPRIADALEPISGFAATGTDSRTALLGRLPEVIDSAVSAGRAPESGGLIDRTLAGLRGWITVRRIDGRGDGNEAALARAEIAARRDDLETAVAEMARLEGAAAKAAADWIAAARARLAADAAGAKIGGLVLSGLSGG